MPAARRSGMTHAVGAEPGRAAHDRAEVARVGDRVEGHDQRRLAGLARPGRAGRRGGRTRRPGSGRRGPGARRPRSSGRARPLVTSSRLDARLGGQLEGLAQPAVALGALGDVDAADRACRRAAPRRPSCARPPTRRRGPVRRLGRAAGRAPPWPSPCRPCGWGGPWPWGSAPCPRGHGLTRPPEPGGRALGGLADRALALELPAIRRACFQGPRGPSGVSSISMPAALIRSRIASAAAKSFAARASARCSSRPRTRTSTAWVSRSVPDARGRPGRVVRVQTEHVEHGQHRGRGCRAVRRVAVRQQAVALADHVVDRRDGRRGPEVVVHRGHEVGAREAAGAAARRPAAAPLDVPLDPAEATRGLVERLEGELDVGAVVGGDHVEPQLDAAHPLEHRRAPAASCRATCSSSRRRW